MILVAVGTSQFRFDRLLRAVDGLPTTEPLVVQHGPSDVRPEAARCVSFVPFHELAELIRDARVVVTHGGVGSILLSLTHGKRPFVVPRRRAFGETVDDHQVESARRFAQAGLVHLVEEPAELPSLLAAAVGDDEPVVPAGPRELPLVRDLRDYLQRVLEPQVSR
jgi:UDP-N-acetylglucosamine--N-acetylmuramyl-(pentapeptide) pyrophosphoryl-undecaprenol N-acetylglucosamine transferase